MRTTCRHETTTNGVKLFTRSHNNQHSFLFVFVCVFFSLFWNNNEFERENIPTVISSFGMLAVKSPLSNRGVVKIKINSYQKNLKIARFLHKIKLIVRDRYRVEKVSKSAHNFHHHRNILTFPTLTSINCVWKTTTRIEKCEKREKRRENWEKARENAQIIVSIRMKL